VTARRKAENSACQPDRECCQIVAASNGETSGYTTQGRNDGKVGSDAVIANEMSNRRSFTPVLSCNRCCLRFGCMGRLCFVRTRAVTYEKEGKSALFD
jgi:hypothetical protein